MKIVIPGGTGQVGTLLARAFHLDGHEVTALGRSPARAPWRVDNWNPEQLGDWTRWIDGSDVVINMAGRSVNCRYNTKNRQEIMHSRVGSTRVVGQAIARARRPPTTWLQASTATIYAHRYDAPNDDETGILGGSEADAPDTWRFSIEVATSWERALDEADVPGTRKIKLRSAVILSPDRGGIFDTILGLVHDAAAEENKRWGSDQITVQTELVGDRPAASQPEDALIVQSGWAAAQSIGLEPGLAGPSSTDSNYPMSLGIPSMTTRGGGVAEGTHSLDECFDPTGAYQGPQATFKTILGLVGAQGVSQPLLPNAF